MRDLKMLTNSTLQYQQRIQTNCRGEVYNIANTRSVDGQIVTLILVRLDDGALVTAYVRAEDGLRLGEPVELIEQARGGLAQAYRLGQSG
jgi:predicted acyltransferase (DUF342 family)